METLHHGAKSLHGKNGFKSTSDWKAKWIESTSPADSITAPALLFRKQFHAGKKVQSATAYITTHGMYEAMINGNRVGNYYLTPGWTSYNKRIQYQAYDVNIFIKGGKQCSWCYYRKWMVQNAACME